MDVQEIAKRVKRLEVRMDGMETRIKGLDDAVQRAVASMMPKMDALLKAQNARTNDGCSDNRGSTEQATGSASASASLLEAAEGDDVEALLRLLKDGADVQQRDPRGNTALHIATSQGHLSATWVLLGFGVSADIPGEHLRTPLHCAAAHGRLEVAQRLLDAGAKVGFLDACGDTALFLAAKRGHEDVVALLLRRESSVDVCAKSGETLLVHAAKANQWGLVMFLLQQGASAIKCKEAKESPLALAAEAGRDDVVRDLLRRGAASDKKQVEEALNATETGAVVWAFTQALSSADNVDVLGDHGKRAAKEGRLQLLTVLLETGVVSSSWQYIKSKQHLLHFAAGNGHLECVKKLLQHGATVDVTDYYGDSPLHLASRAGHAPCARALLAAGASTTIQNSYGKTPVDDAKDDDIRGIFHVSQ